MMRSSVRVLIGVAIAATANVPAAAADQERGRGLYENHCQTCHTSKVHGRVQRWPGTLEELRAIVDRWQTQQNLQWSGEDIADVVYYLNVAHYSF
jgi:cytochrome c2